MEGVVAGFLAHAGQPADYMPGAEHWPLLRTAILLAFIPLTLVAILLLYGGNVQNSNIGPLAVRGMTTLKQTLQAPRTIITSELEAKKVRCTFYLQYFDRHGRARMIRLAKGKKFVFKLKALNMRHPSTRSDLVGFWNQPSWDSLHTALDENQIPYEVQDNNILMNETLDDERIRKLLSKPVGEIISMPDDEWKQLIQSHSAEIMARMRAFGKFAKRNDRRKRKKKFDDANSPILRKMQIFICVCIFPRTRFPTPTAK